MEILIRQTSGVNNDDALFTDHAHDVKSLRIGCAPDQELQLIGDGILPNHAELIVTEQGARLRCRRGAGVTVNGTKGRKFGLSIGDVIQIGSNTIEVVPAPDGFDIGIVVSRSSSDVAILYEQAYQTDLSQTRLSPRLLGWSLTLVVLLVSMAIPLAYHFTKKPGTSVHLADASWPVSDKVWSSGPLHKAHASMQDSCNSCHVKLFQKVTNDSCKACHSDTQDHVMAVAANSQLPVEMNGTCAGCHREHNEPVSSLINTSDKVCMDCHALHDLQSDSYALGRVENFGVDTHAPFHVSLLKPPAGGSYDITDEWVSSRELLAQAKENSQLKFNHEVHYDSNKVTAGEDAPLTCANCHELSDEGEHFKSIEFEQNCANSGCHELDLDPRNRLPHGLPDVTVAAIEGYYLRKFANPDKPESSPVRERRRLLDRPANADSKCTGNAYDCALELAANKIEQQFNTTGCVTCHQIKDVGGEVLDRYQVAVVKLNEDYLADARFDHLAHNILVEPGSVKTYTGDDSCVYCHAAPTSSNSEDVLIPVIDTCTTCHNGPETELNVPLGCIDCHGYHPTL